MTTAPTGIPITRCPKCDRIHPATRKHCDKCQSPSAFIHNGLCIGCRNETSSTTWRKS